MRKFESSIELPVDDLQKRREKLEEALKETVTEMVTKDIKDAISTSLENANIKITDISWDFYPESDDEGGSVYYPEGLLISTEEDIDPDDFIIKVKSKYSDAVYEEALRDVVMEILCDNSSDLYDFDIYEIEF